MKNIPKLNEIFDMNPMDEKKQTELIETVVNPNKEMDIQDDYQLARDTMRKLLIKGEDTLDEVINLAKNSESPRTYEVTGQMIKTLSDVAKDLMGLQKQVKELDEIDKPAQIGTQNNVVFAGSTHELMKMLGKTNDNNTIDQ